MFYPIEHDLSIKPGDLIVARCTMYNNQTELVRIGNTAADEMCNFYIMYYVNRMDKILDRKVCFTPGPPLFYWSKILYVPEDVDEDASKIL